MDRDKRKSALNLCLDKNWSEGVLLVSAAWKTPRKLLDDVRALNLLPNEPVRVGVLNVRGKVSREDFLHTFPQDVALSV